MPDTALQTAARATLDACRAAGWRVATAESCTGGLIAGALTAITGASDVMDRGFVTYSNAAKTDMLGVPDSLLVHHGAVSEPVARAMAEGAISRSRAAIAVAVTGIAGPGGGGKDKPVGLVCFGLATPQATSTERHVFTGDRDAVRHAAVLRALWLIRAQAGRPCRK